jgi:hypothetical protein
VARHIFQACPVWIYTQSNITQASYSPEYITPTQQISGRLFLFSLTTEMSAGQSDRHNQICACQNTANRVFVPVNDRDRTLISRLALSMVYSLTEKLGNCALKISNRTLLVYSV